MKVVAFLQNMWVRNPAKIQRMFDSDPTGELRLRLIEYALFAGCLTGRRLKKGLGEDWCDAIIWEEASPVIDNDYKRYHPPEEAHITAVLAKHQPDLVLCFTKRGEPTVKKLCKCPVIGMPHPAARGKAPILALEATRKQLEFERVKRLGS